MTCIQKSSPDFSLFASPGLAPRSGGVIWWLGEEIEGGETEGEMMKRLLFVVLLLIGLTGLLPMSASAHTGYTQVGNNYGITIETKGNNLFTDSAAADIASVGNGWVRPQVYESTLETSPGQYDWTLMNTVVANAKAHGLLIDYAMQHFNSYDLGGSCGLPTPAAESAFAKALLDKYGAGVFSAIEVGNEEWSFAGKGCSQMESLYAPALEAASQTIRSYGYGILVGMYGFTGYQSMTPITNFFGAMASDPTHPLSYIDYTNIHFYHAGDDPNYQASNGQPALMDIINNIHNLTSGAVSIPTWVTEYGWDTNCNTQNTCNVISPDLQSQYINEVLQDMVNYPTVFGKEFLYTMDAGVSAKSITQNGVPLPAYGMLKNFIQSHPAAPQKPLSYCAGEQCDGLLAGNTSCPTNDQQWQNVVVTDSHNVNIGNLYSYYGPLCYAFWVTFLPKYTNGSTEYYITSTERSYDCSNCDMTRSNYGSIAGHYIDAPMQGQDDVQDNGKSQEECFIGGLDFVDVYGAQRHFNVATICF